MTQPESEMRPQTRAGRMSAIRRIQVLVGMLVALVLAGAIASVLSRAEVSASTAQLRDHWVPASTQAGVLRQGYTDQAAGELGYLLTGRESFLQRYRSGRRSAAGARARLMHLLPDDPAVNRLVTGLGEAADTWQVAAVDPQIAARSRHPLPNAALLADVAAASTLFDAVRSRMSAIDGHTRAGIASELSQIKQEQSRADVITALTVALTVLLAGFGVFLLRRTLLLPARVLLQDVDRVASGAYLHPIAEAGPREYVAVSHAVDRMRNSILRHADDLADTRRRLALVEEQERFAADLHDRTVQRLFALGLTLASVAARHPELAGTIEALVDETDDILRELRSVIFGLRRDQLIADVGSHVTNLVQESARSLGFRPDLEVTGPVERVPAAAALELISTLREALSNVARHAGATQARVTVAVREDELHLQVADDGRGFLPGADARGYGLANMETRATRLGGTATISAGPGAGTTLDWQVPMDVAEAS